MSKRVCVDVTDDYESEIRGVSSVTDLAVAMVDRKPIIVDTHDGQVAIRVDGMEYNTEVGTPTSGRWEIKGILPFTKQSVELLLEGNANDCMIVHDPPVQAGLKSAWPSSPINNPRLSPQKRRTAWGSYFQGQLPYNWLLILLML